MRIKTTDVVHILPDSRFPCLIGVFLMNHHTVFVVRQNKYFFSSHFFLFHSLFENKVRIMTYNASITQDPTTNFRDPLVFYDPDLTTGNTQATDFGYDDLTLPSQQNPNPLTDTNNTYPTEDLDGNKTQQRDLPFEDEEEGFYEKDLPKHACAYD